MQRLQSAVDELRKIDKELRWPDYWVFGHHLSLKKSPAAVAFSAAKTGHF